MLPTLQYLGIIIGKNELHVKMCRKMFMNISLKRIVASVILVGVCCMTVASPASAHVTVKPAEVLTASFQTFTVSVPNEKDEPAIEVRVLIPPGLQHVMPTVKPGWNITSQKQGE